VLELFGLAIPLELFGSLMFGATGVFAAVGLSYLITGGAAWIVLNRVLTRYEQQDVPYGYRQPRR